MHLQDLLTRAARSAYAHGERELAADLNDAVLRTQELLTNPGLQTTATPELLAEVGRRCNGRYIFHGVVTTEGKLQPEFLSQTPADIVNALGLIRSLEVLTEAAYRKSQGFA